MHLSFLLILLIASGCWSDAKPDKPVRKRTIVSHSIAHEDGSWSDGMKMPDGSVGRFNVPSTPSSSKLGWGSEYDITTQMRWNSLKGMFDCYFVSLDKTTDRTGKTYEISGITLDHIAVFDSKTGKGRFSNQRNMCSSFEEKSATNKDPKIRRCGQRFIASGESIDKIQSMTGTHTLVMEHAKKPNPDRVISVK